jgi:hypothetical protein
MRQIFVNLRVFVLDTTDKEAVEIIQDCLDDYLPEDMQAEVYEDESQVDTVPEMRENDGAS